MSTVASTRTNTLRGFTARVSAFESRAVAVMTQSGRISRFSVLQAKGIVTSKCLTRPAAAELLKNRITLECGESKIIGNKLIFKGSARISVLYRGEDDAPHTVESDLPFSQIMEVSGVTEDAGCNLSLALTGAECELSEEGAWLHSWS